MLISFPSSTEPTELKTHRSNKNNRGPAHADPQLFQDPRVLLLIASLHLSSPLIASHPSSYPLPLMPRAEDPARREGEGLNSLLGPYCQTLLRLQQKRHHSHARNIGISCKQIIPHLKRQARRMMPRRLKNLCRHPIEQPLPGNAAYSTPSKNACAGSTSFTAYIPLTTRQQSLRMQCYLPTSYTHTQA